MESTTKSTTLHTGAQMPSIGFGTSEVKDKEIIVQAVCEANYMHIDTAKMYQNEDVVGDALLECFEKGIKREEIFVTTKIFNESYSDPVSTLKGSLQRLKLDYVDMYLIHWGYNEIDESGKSLKKIPMYKLWAGLEECVEQGLTKHIGLSNFNVQLILDMFSYCKIQPACNQIELHPFLQQPDLVKFCQSKEIVITAYSPLSAPGRSSGGVTGGSALENEVIKDIADSKGKTPAQIALAWNINRNVVVIPKCSSLKRAQENYQAVEIDLSQEEMGRISEIDKDERIFDPKNWKLALNVPYFK